MSYYESPYDREATDGARIAYRCPDCQREWAVDDTISSRDTGDLRDNVYPGDRYCPQCKVVCDPINEQ